MKNIKKHNVLNWVVNKDSCYLFVMILFEGPSYSDDLARPGHYFSQEMRFHSLL